MTGLDRIRAMQRRAAIVARLWPQGVPSGVIAQRAGCRADSVPDIARRLGLRRPPRGAEGMTPAEREAYDLARRKHVPAAEARDFALRAAR